jgi:hypothetical protein
MGSCRPGVQAKLLSSEADTGRKARLMALIDASSWQNRFAQAFDEIKFARIRHGDDDPIRILVKDVFSALDAAPDSAEIVLPRAVR